MKILILLLVSSCSSVVYNNRYNSDVFYTRCYNSELYHIRYDDPERIFIPIFDNDGKRVKCSKTLAVDLKK